MRTAVRLRWFSPSDTSALTDRLSVTNPPCRSPRCGQGRYLLGHPQSQARVPRCAVASCSHSHPPPTGRQESPSAPMIEGTKKRSNESETVVVSKKNSRRAPDVTEPDITPDEPFWLSPDRDGYVRPLGCAGVDRAAEPRPPSAFALTMARHVRAAQGRSPSSRIRAFSRTGCACPSSPPSACASRRLMTAPPTRSSPTGTPLSRASGSG